MQSSFCLTCCEYMYIFFHKSPKKGKKKKSTHWAWDWQGHCELEVCKDCQCLESWIDFHWKVGEWWQKGPCPQLAMEAMKAIARGPETRLVPYWCFTSFSCHFTLKAKRSKYEATRWPSYDKLSFPTASLNRVSLTPPHHALLLWRRIMGQTLRGK